MESNPQPQNPPLESILSVVHKYWGFEQLRPLQEEAIRAGCRQRDSVVVLPTGGGKSLCYQVPPVLSNRLHVVASPLISLMKDQIDGLRTCGYPAVALHSGMSREQRSRAMEFIASGACRLLLAAPERLVTPGFLNFIARRQVEAFAIDEAHCISHWGHDFRPEYRQLALLKDHFPAASVHAYTATATERVRRDIAEQLRLQDPLELVGCFDRPNLIYRIIPRQKTQSQIEEVIGRHQGQAVIIYCLSRADTEKVAAALKQRGIRAAFYHAGMPAPQRRDAQDAFSREEVDVIVATVAFGMGIDRSDVRCVIHAAMPKSIEHYQQETGRAGRDGLEAECVLLYSPVDVLRWQSLIDRSSQEMSESGALRRSASRLLADMRSCCSPGRCRHKYLSEYFGQAYEKQNCEACDTCLGESGQLEDQTVPAQKILSCVARVGQRFGVGHVVDVLRGADSQQIRSLGHDRLSTYGLLKEIPRKPLIYMLYQLIDQDLLERTSGEFPLLKLNPSSLEVLKGERRVKMLPVKTRISKKSVQETVGWQGVDRNLFESLRGLRSRLARDRAVPAYVIFSDASLREMARTRPFTRNEFLTIPGVGARKLQDLGDIFIDHIRRYSDDQSSPAVPARDSASPHDAAIE